MCGNKKVRRKPHKLMGTTYTMFELEFHIYLPQNIHNITEECPIPRIKEQQRFALSGNPQNVNISVK